MSESQSEDGCVFTPSPFLLMECAVHGNERSRQGLTLSAREVYTT